MTFKIHSSLFIKIYIRKFEQNINGYYFLFLLKTGCMSALYWSSLSILAMHSFNLFKMIGIAAIVLEVLALKIFNFPNISWSASASDAPPFNWDSTRTSEHHKVNWRIVQLTVRFWFLNQVSQQRKSYNVSRKQTTSTYIQLKVAVRQGVPNQINFVVCSYKNHLFFLTKYLDINYANQISKNLCHLNCPKISSQNTMAFYKVAY